MAMTFPLLSVCIFLLFYGYGIEAQENKCRTTENFPSLFLESCRELNFNTSHCNASWEAFRGAFAGVDPAEINASYYDLYFNLFPIRGMADQFLFWSRTQSLVNLVSMMNSMGTNIVSSANLPSSGIINRVNKNAKWCGTDQGIDFENNCTCNITNLFWKRFSARLAQAAEGIVFFLGDGTVVAFNSSSFFSTVELPNMRAGVVTHVVALIVHDKGSGESCSDNSGSLVTLRNRVRGKNFTFDCFDIYGQVNDANQQRTIADCALSTISKVQQEKEGNQRQIECVNGVYKVKFTVELLLISLCVNIKYLF